MTVLPSLPELILVVFTALLSFISSFLILRIKNSPKKIENDRKILIANQKEVEELIRGRQITSQEIKDAKIFVEKDVPLYFMELDTKINEIGKPSYRILFFLAGIFSGIISTFSLFMIYTLFWNPEKMKVTFILLASGVMLFVIYILVFRRSIKRYFEINSVIKNILLQLDRDIEKAFDILRRGVNL
jgi:hypothetical protein